MGSIVLHMETPWCQRSCICAGVALVSSLSTTRMPISISGDMDLATLIIMQHTSWMQMMQMWMENKVDLPFFDCTLWVTTYVSSYVYFYILDFANLIQTYSKKCWRTASVIRGRQTDFTVSLRGPRVKGYIPLYQDQDRLSIQDLPPVKIARFFYVHHSTIGESQFNLCN